MEGIKNLVIDLGGVLINLTRNRCIEAFESLGRREYPRADRRITTSIRTLFHADQSSEPLRWHSFREGIRASDRDSP